MLTVRERTQSSKTSGFDGLMICFVHFFMTVEQEEQNVVEVMLMDTQFTFFGEPHGKKKKKRSVHLVSKQNVSTKYSLHRLH